MWKPGVSLKAATVMAAQQRFRPIVMTSLAFIFGVVPLAIAVGAASRSQQAIGTGVMGGMIAATVLAIFFVPVFFVVVMRFFERKRLTAEDLAEVPAAEPSKTATVAAAAPKT
jgi:multidrug efflux pump